MALLEGLIAITFMIIVFAGIWFFHGLYRARNNSLRQARFEAWDATRPKDSCSGEVESTVEKVVPVPSPVYVGWTGVGSQQVTSHAAMVCNEIPEHSDDLFTIASKMVDVGGDLVSGFTDFAADAIF